MTMPATPHAADQPIADFSHCHEGILKKLDLLGEIPSLLDSALRVRALAENTLDFFREAIFEHHLDEERELFPAVLSSAEPGTEHDQVMALVKQLTHEHRSLEQAWKRLEPCLKKLAKGQLVPVGAAEVTYLLTYYRAHAELEESQFLPLAQSILSRNAHDMGALGLSLHMRHSPASVKATYI